MIIHNLDLFSFWSFHNKQDAIYSNVKNVRECGDSETALLINSN
jgi:hypothetical protein